MDRKGKLTAIVVEAIEEVNQLLAPGKRISSDPDSPLADGGSVDSMSLVNLIVATEQRIEDQFDVEVSLAEGMAEDNDAFANVTSLVAYIDSLLAEESHG